MARLHHYRNDYEQYQSSTSGALLFVGLLAAIIIAALVWSTYGNMQSNGMATFPQTQPMESAPPTAPAR